MRHFTSFLQQLHDLKERAARLEPDVHYARLDAVLNTLSILKATMTYRDLGKVLGVASARLAAMLARRMEDDHANREPLSSALIVNRNTGISSNGFFDMARRLGYTFRDPQQFWREQSQACHARFGETTISMMFNSGLLDDEQEKAERLDSAIANTMIDAGASGRLAWSAETTDGQRIIRLRTGNHVALEFTPKEFMEIADDQMIAHFKEQLKR